MIPGPSSYSKGVREAISREIIGHRTAEFEQIVVEICSNMKKVFLTKGDVMLFTSSSTGAIESGISNFLSHSDKALVVSNGAFGERLASIASFYSSNVSHVKIPYAKPILPEHFKQLRKDTKLVCLVHNETSMGVENPLREIAKEVKERSPDCLLFVDCVSSLGGTEFEMDKWGIDIAASGSQKCLAAPPGLGMLAAWKDLYSEAKPRNYYLGLSQYTEYMKKNQTPFTPSVPLFFGLREALREVFSEGLEKRFSRHRKCALKMRDGIRKLMLELFVHDDFASKSVTSVVHEKPSWLKEEMFKRGVVIEGAKGETSIVRRGHLGNVTEKEVDITLNVLGEVVK